MNFSNAQSNDRPVLVTGVTGYIGGRLVPRLFETGVRVRCLARDASRLQGRPWRGDVELVVGDVLRPESLETPPDHVDRQPGAVGDLVLRDRLLRELLEGREDDALRGRERERGAPVGGLPLSVRHVRPRGPAD